MRLGVIDVGSMASMSAAERRSLPFRVDSLAVCPWVLREGLILRYLDGLTGRQP